MTAPFRQQPMPWDWRLPAYDYADPSLGVTPQAPIPGSDASFYPDVGYGASNYMAPPQQQGRPWDFGLPGAQFGQSAVPGMSMDMPIAPPMGQQQPQGPLAEMDLLPPGPPEASPGFFDFLRSQPGAMSDMALASAIFARSFTHPGEALQWAMQMKEQRMAQQARMEEKQLVADEQKARQKATQDEGRIRQAYAKATTTKGFDVNAWEAENGPVTPENYPKFMGDMATKRAETEKQEKEEADRVKYLGYVNKGVLGINNVPERYRKDPEFATRALQLMGEKQQRDEFDRQYKELKMEALRASKRLTEKRGELIDKLTPTQKAELAVIEAKMGLIETEITSLTKDLNSDDSLGLDMWDTRQTKIAQLQDRLATYNQLLEEMRSVPRGGKSETDIMEKVPADAAPPGSPTPPKKESAEDPFLNEIDAILDGK